MSGIRTATADDIDFLVSTDLVADEAEPELGEGFDHAEHRAKIAAFVEDPDQDAWIYDDREDRAVGMLLVRFRDTEKEPDTPANRLLLERVFPEIDPKWFPADRRFAEVFQLWVAPGHRRRGIATALKRHLETACRGRGVLTIYTHTNAVLEHVVAMNLALGYAVVRTGPVWDATPRTSLIKRLTPRAPDSDRS